MEVNFLLTVLVTVKNKKNRVKKNCTFIQFQFLKTLKIFG